MTTTTATRTCNDCGVTLPAERFGSDRWKCKRCKGAATRRCVYRRCDLCGRPSTKAHRCADCSAWAKHYHAVVVSLELQGQGRGPGLPEDELERRIELYRGRAEQGKPLFDGEVGT